MKWFSHLLLIVVVTLMMLGFLTSCNLQRSEDVGKRRNSPVIADTTAIDTDHHKKHPDDDREV